VSSSPTTFSATTGTGTATATCSVGNKVIGGGFSASGYDKFIDILDTRESYPPNQTSWRVTLDYSSGSGSDVTFTAYAICVTVP
jgi:hypothetical protein